MLFLNCIISMQRQMCLSRDNTPESLDIIQSSDVNSVFKSYTISRINIGNILLLSGHFHFFGSNPPALHPHMSNFS